jgi:hypothetical protein
MIGVAETVLIAAMVDMVVVVVDTRRLHPERLQDCLLRLDNAGANVIGIVLNRTRRRRRGAYNYGYYGHEDAKLVPPAPAPAPGEAPVVVARNRWVGGSPSADKPVQVVPPVQSVGGPGRQGRSGRAGAARPPVFRSPGAGRPDDASDNARQAESRRRQPEW